MYALTMFAIWFGSIVLLLLFIRWGERDQKALDRELDRAFNRPDEPTQATDRQRRRWKRWWETFGNG